MWANTSSRLLLKEFFKDCSEGQKSQGPWTSNKTMWKMYPTVFNSLMIPSCKNQNCFKILITGMKNPHL